MKPQTLPSLALLKKLSLPAVALALSLAGTIASPAETLIDDTLTSLTPTDLAGTTPDVANTPGHEYTNSSGTFVRGTTGTQEDINSTGIAGLQIPTITANSGTYTLSITETDGVGGFRLLGFDAETTTESSPDFYYGEYVNSPTGPVMLVNGAGQAFAYPATNGGTSYASGQGVTAPIPGATSYPTVSVGPNVLTLKLDTDGSAWTVQAFINGVQLTSGGLPATYTYASGTDPVINQIVFGDGGGGAIYSNLSLVQTPNIPEPSTWVLFGAGLLSLAALVRFRRRRS